jgi:predicted dehydrogenase
MQRRNFLLSSLATATALSAATPNAHLATPDEARKRKKLKVGIIGCGRMGQYFAEVYRALPDTELVAIAEWNDDRRKVVGERFGVKALYKDADAMLREVVPDLAAVITPTKFMKDAVIACAEAGVKGVSTDKPIAARLSDADAMVDACKKRNVVFAGGNLQRAMWEVQQAAQRLQSGEYGALKGAAVHRFGGEISGGGCQHLSVLRLFTGAEVEEVMAWGRPAEALQQESDEGLEINGVFRMSSGIDCQVFGAETPYRGVDAWTDQALVRWDWAPPEIHETAGDGKVRSKVDAKYRKFPWQYILDRPHLRLTDNYLVSSIRSFVDAVATGSDLFVSGHDLRQALEIAIASKLSAQLGNQPVRLPLDDRSLTLYPRPYRWLGGDATGKPQTSDDAAGKKPDA